ncbi:MULTISPECIES: PRC-barrel domain-containing protein [unclassified Sinorhizobium]|uniref:PRC-barrel domain-containing protein n=1 Tax=unclassified Sinorhizobium TaxID=2613772 RepID=UPI0024C30ECE|nr:MULTISPECIES: PRC-barrel domain-containing protein [unclassified Sinorhizobium]MDK1375795.1 PRC-barrel domain-containing protein [Sinorhizobium sp. 6-70]MDK1478607.1 PRC-barrel domain-containing protein [Sinorhizobium sp. 6-117]
MTKKLVSSVAAGALLVGVTFAPTSFAQQTTTPPPADPAAPTQTQPGGTTPPATEPPADQAQTPPPAEKPADTAAAKSDYLTEQADDQIATSTYVGQSVYNAADESIGEINDLIIKKDGGVEAAVIGVGGFLGIGEKNVAVPFDRIEISEQADTAALKLTTTETADTLKAAPEFKTKSQMMAERNAAQPVDTSTTSSTGTTPATPTQPSPQQ